MVPRAASEEAAAAVADLGARLAIVRLLQVHDTVRQGLVTYAIHLAREKVFRPTSVTGSTAGQAYRLDTAHLYRLVLEKTDGGARYHAVTEEGVPARDIAEAIG